VRERAAPRIAYTANRYSPSTPKHRENRLPTISQKRLSNGLDPLLMLKLLVASHVRRRNTLLSSKAIAL
jgi:hypothetical protein